MISDKNKVRVCTGCGKTSCTCGNKTYVERQYKVTKEK